MTKDETLIELESALEALVNRCNDEFGIAADAAVIAAEATLERIYRARTALAEQPAAPPGHVVVPVEPTEAMVLAGAMTEGMKAVDALSTLSQIRMSRDQRPNGWPGVDAPLVQAYRAMIAARPEVTK